MLPSLATLLTAVVSLGAVLGLILLAARAARFGGLATRFPRNVPRNSARLLEVRDVLALDNRRSLHLVRCDGRDVLLLTGGPQDVVVGWMPDPARLP